MGDPDATDSEYVRKAAEMFIRSEGSEAGANARARAEAMLVAGRPHLASVWMRIARAIG